jgi:hypothetical protein
MKAHALSRDTALTHNFPSLAPGKRFGAFLAKDKSAPGGYLRMAKKVVTKSLKPRGRELRSQLWFDNPQNPGMTALYLERYLNYGLTLKELTSGKPIIGIAQTGSDLSPCNRHHLDLAQRVRAGIRSVEPRYLKSRSPIVDTLGAKCMPMRYSVDRKHRLTQPVLSFGRNGTSR